MLRAMSMPTLIYFASRGRAELIRLILVEAGVDWQELPVGRGAALAAGNVTDLDAMKGSERLPFDTVPVWEEPDGFRLAQSHAIAAYLARAHGLFGATPREAAECDQMLGAFADLRAELRRLLIAAPGERAAVRAELTDRVVPRWLGHLDRLLAADARGGGFVVGNALTVADLALWYLVELVRDYGFTAALAAHPRLLAHFDRISARPRVADYVRSPRRHPLAPPPA